MTVFLLQNERFYRCFIQEQFKGVICYTDRMMRGFLRAAAMYFFVGPVKLDTTFGREIYTTFYAYRNVTVVTKEGNHPLFLGPVVFHEKEKDALILDYFIHHVDRVRREDFPNMKQFTVGSDECSILEKSFHANIPGKPNLIVSISNENSYLLKNNKQFYQCKNAYLTIINNYNSDRRFMLHL